MARTGKGWSRIIAGAVIAAALTIGAPAMSAGEPDGVDAVTTPGTGWLTTCRSWLVYNSCVSRRRVALPERIAVGDQIRLRYGSNPKNYVFHVVRMRQQGDLCTILSAASGANEEGEKIEVAQCRATAQPATEAR